MSRLNSKTTVEIEVKTVSWANGKAQKCQAIARVKDGKGETIKTFLGDPRGNKHFALTSLVSECELFAAAARRVSEEVALMQLG
jgi:hypothetical protein